MKKIVLILTAALFAITGASAQSAGTKGFKARAIIINGDTLPEFTLPIVRVYGQKIFKNKNQRRKYDKLVRDVKKAYPLAKLAGVHMREWDIVLARIQDETTRKEYMKKAEDDIKAQFTAVIKNLTYSQGKILIKLIDRETGQTSFMIIKEMRGTLQAFFWQTLAQVFGNNLKTEYDGLGEDKTIEEIVQKIENGDI
ncbi:MAG: DUF4294 domain-containing protein [Bacteroidota bacterium]